MKKIKQPLLIKITLMLIIILLSIFIIKECKILGFCYTIVTLISPVFFGYIIAWLLKPIMFFFNKKFSVLIATSITYILISILMGVLGYLSLPVIINEIKELISFFIDFYNRMDSRILNNINLSEIGANALAFLQFVLNNTKDKVLNLFYALFFAFFFLLNHEIVSRFFAKFTPRDLIYDISMNLKAYVKGTIIDTIILFILSLIIFYFIKLPYYLLFAIIVSLTNIIPYVGPYIGGIPATILAFGINSELGLMVLGALVFLQIIESYFVHPYIMSKVLKINQIFIMLSLIICGYFWGIIGMLISTPIISVIKTLYEYYKAHHFFNFQVLDK